MHIYLKIINKVKKNKSENINMLNIYFNNKEIKSKKYTILFLLIIFTIVMTFTSCVSFPQREYISISRKISDTGKLSATDLARFFRKNNKDISYFKVKKFAQTYINEATMENINSDVAFAQMCLETGYLTYGNLVTPDMNNFCGLGSTDPQHPGEIFATEQLGIRAHIQHLQAYATTEDIKLNNQLIDPRYNWVHKTKYIQTIDQLAGTWAMDPDYGNKLENILARMEYMVN